jgi:hypothetical protein
LKRESVMLEGLFTVQRGLVQPYVKTRLHHQRLPVLTPLHGLHKLLLPTPGCLRQAVLRSSLSRC